MPRKTSAPAEPAEKPARGRGRGKAQAEQAAPVVAPEAPAGPAYVVPSQAVGKVRQAVMFDSEGDDPELDALGNRLVEERDRELSARDAVKATKVAIRARMKETGRVEYKARGCDPPIVIKLKEVEDRVAARREKREEREAETTAPAPAKRGAASTPAAGNGCAAIESEAADPLEDRMCTRPAPDGLWCAAHAALNQGQKAHAIQRRLERLERLQ